MLVEKSFTYNDYKTLKQLMKVVKNSFFITNDVGGIITSDKGRKGLKIKFSIPFLYSNHKKNWFFSLNRVKKLLRAIPIFRLFKKNRNFGPLYHLNETYLSKILWGTLFSSHKEPTYQKLSKSVRWSQRPLDVLAWNDPALLILYAR